MKARRSFLAGLATVLAAPAAVAATTTTPAKAAPSIQELPELLAIGEKLPALIEAYRTAKQRKAEAATLFDQLCPARPDELICTDRRDRGAGLDLTEQEANYLTGELIGERRVYHAKSLRLHIIRHDVPRTTKEGRRLRRLARLAMKFESARAAAYKASGYGDREGDADRVTGKLDAAGRAVLRMAPITMAGVTICARLAAVLGEILDDQGRITDYTLSAALGRQVAVSLLRIEGGAQ